MKGLHLVILAILATACCVIALFLYLLWSMKAPVPTLPESSTGYTLEALAINITILEMVLGLVGFLVAVLGFFGYAGIKSAAVDAAEMEARKEINAQMVKWKREQEASARDAQSENDGDFSGSDASVIGAVPAGQEE